jgi:hypothetical protein
MIGLVGCGKRATRPMAMSLTGFAIQTGDAEDIG